MCIYGYRITHYRLYYTHFFPSLYSVCEFTHRNKYEKKQCEEDIEKGTTTTTKKYLKNKTEKPRTTITENKKQTQSE